MQSQAWSRVYDVAEFLFGEETASSKTYDDVLAELERSPKLDPELQQKEALLKYINGCRCSFSSNIADMLIAGYGRANEFFEYELPFDFLVGWILTEKELEAWAHLL